MTVVAYDLLSEQWIPVRNSNGQLRQVGLRDALLNAAEFRTVDDTAPTVEFGIYRLLEALVLDIFTPSDRSALTRLIKTQGFDQATINAYFSKWSDRFDLFDKVHPFLQIAGMKNAAEKPLAGLMPLIPSGTNAIHFHHSQEGDFAVSPAVAARFLCTVAPFMTSGGAGLAPSINGAPPWYAHIQGKNLFETICRNLYVEEIHGSTGAPPAWRNDTSLDTSKRSASTSLLESMTWRPRKIQFIPGTEGICSVTGQLSNILVRVMKFEAGLSCGFPEDAPWRDPNVPYRIDAKRGRIARRPQEGKDIWRDTAAIALLEDGKGGFERPAILSQFAKLIETSDDKYQLNLSLYGMRTDMKMKVFEWTREHLVVPMRLVWQSDLHSKVLEQSGKAEEVASAIRHSIKLNYPRGGSGNDKAFNGLIITTERYFWQNIRPEFDYYLQGLANADGDEEKEILARDTWWSTIKRLSKHALNDAIDGLDTNAKALERQAKALKSFDNAIFKILMTEEQKIKRQNESLKKKGGKK